jgi:hypothetical protein
MLLSCLPRLGLLSPRSNSPKKSPRSAKDAEMQTAVRVSDNLFKKMLFEV